MSAVVYDVVYDTRMIKTRKNMFTVRLLAVTLYHFDDDKQKKNRSAL